MKNNIKFYIRFLSVIFFLHVPLEALIVGSKSAASSQVVVTFPSATVNKILGYTALERGFILTDNLTACTFDGYLPVSGAVTLNGGILYLYKDFVLSNTLSSITGGIIRGNYHTVELPQIAADYTLPGIMRFDRTTLVCNSNVSITGALNFSNVCKIDARGKRLTFNGGSIVVRPNSYLILENACLANFGTARLQCLSNTASITLRNCVISLASDYTFSQGSLLFDLDNIIIGTNKFIYSSPVGSTIASGAMLQLDRSMTLSYAPSRANQNLIFMQDSTSYLYLDGCTVHSTRTGLHLSNGTLIIDDKVTMSSEAKNTAESFWLDSNLNIVVRAGAVVEIFGSVKYQ